MADDQQEDPVASEGFTAQNQQNDESSVGNDGAENPDSSPGSFRHREDGDEDEEGSGQTAQSIAMDDDQSHQMPTLSSADGQIPILLSDGQMQPLLDGQIPTQPLADGVGHICKECGAWYKLRQSLNSHIQDQHQCKRYRCLKCSYSTNRRHDLYRHDGQVHKLGKIGTPRMRNIAPKVSPVAAAAAVVKKNRKSPRLGKRPHDDEGQSSNAVMLQGDSSNAQQLIVVSDGMQGAVYSGPPSPLDQDSAGWMEENTTRPHRQTESFEHQLPSGAIFRRITEITFFPDGRIRETRTEEYEMP